jgi:hypothetical protein
VGVNMRNAILYSQDLQQQHECTMKVARQLLHKGHARILKFYPFTLQLKSDQEKDDDAAIGIPFKPTNNPPVLSRARRLIEAVEV